MQFTPSLRTVDEVTSIANSGPPARDNHSVRKRSGFRQTVREALARARTEESAKGNGIDQGAITADIDLRESRLSSSRIFRRPRTRPALSFVETHGRVVDTSSLQDSVTLMLASNTPLPHTPTAVIHGMNMAVNSPAQQIHGGRDLRMSSIIAHS